MFTLVKVFIMTKNGMITALFVYLIIHIFQLIFLIETMFFSYNKSAETVFLFVFSAKRTDLRLYVPKSTSTFLCHIYPVKYHAPESIYYTTDKIP